MHRCIPPVLALLVLLAATSRAVDAAAPTPTASPGSKFLWYSHTPMATWGTFGSAVLRNTDDGGLIASWNEYSPQGGTLHQASYIWPCGRVVYTWNTSSLHAVCSKGGVVALTSPLFPAAVDLYNLTDGTLVGSVAAPQPVLAVTLLSSKHGTACSVVLTSVDGIRCYFAASGALGWASPLDLTSYTVPLEAIPVTTPAGVELLVTPGTAAINTVTGKVVWSLAKGAVDAAAVSSDVTVVTFASDVSARAAQAAPAGGAASMTAGFMAVNTSTGAVLWTHTDATLWPQAAAVAPNSGVVLLNQINPNQMRAAAARAGNNYPGSVTAVPLLTGPGPAPNEYLWAYATDETISRLGLLRQFQNETVLQDELVIFVTASNFHAILATTGERRAMFGPFQAYGDQSAPIPANDHWDPSVVYFPVSLLVAPYDVYVAAVKVDASN